MVHQFNRFFSASYRSWLSCVCTVPFHANLYTFAHARGSADSKRWLARQRSDPYVKRARIESFRCRSAFKLLQLQDQLSGTLLTPGDIVVDCGAAPGSWSQVAASYVSEASSTRSNSGLVIAFDLLDFAPLPGVTRFCHVDVRNSTECARLVKKAVCEHLTGTASTDDSGSRVSVVLSDMAPNCTGLRELDIPAMMDLANSVLQLAIRTSAPGASLVVKLWQSSEAEEFKTLVSNFYRGPWISTNSRPHSQSDTGPAVRFLKPPASRMDSTELYLVARGFQLPDDIDR